MNQRQQAQQSLRKQTFVTINTQVLTRPMPAGCWWENMFTCVFVLDSSRQYLRSGRLFICIGQRSYPSATTMLPKVTSLKIFKFKTLHECSWLSTYQYSFFTLIHFVSIKKCLNFNIFLATLVGRVILLICSPFWGRLKHLNNYWMRRRDISSHTVMILRGWILMIPHF